MAESMPAIAPMILAFFRNSNWRSKTVLVVVVESHDHSGVDLQSGACTLCTRSIRLPRTF